MKSGEATSVYGFLKSPSMVDFQGHLAAVFFTSGCNFACGFCHNAALMAKQQAGLSWDRLKRAVENFQRNWVDGVVITGGEPTLAPDLGDLIEYFRARGLAVKLDTNGSRPDVLREVLPQVDLVAMDVKCSAEQYPGFVGFQEPDRIRESIRLIKEGAPAHEFRTTVLDSFHTDAEIERIGALIASASRHVVQAFVPREDLPDPDLRTVPRTSPDRLSEVRQLLEPYVEKVVIRG